MDVTFVCTQMTPVPTSRYFFGTFFWNLLNCCAETVFHPSSFCCWAGVEREAPLWVVEVENWEAALAGREVGVESIRQVFYIETGNV